MNSATPISFASQSTEANLPHGTGLNPRESSAACQTTPLLQTEIEAELDRVIYELGQRAEQAMADRDPVGARIYADRMMGAIASRTPEHQARLEREAYDRVTQDVAYFTSDAALALARGEAF